jgi:hypothetical protein
MPTGCQSSLSQACPRAALVLPRLGFCSFQLPCRLCTLGYLITLGLIFGCVGCGGRVSTANPGPPPPHGGRLILLPDGTGLIEVVKKKGTAPMTGEVSFYFFKDAYTPYEPAPESGILVIDDQRKVPLQADGDALVTSTGPVLFGDDDVDGVLSVELDGEPRQIPLGIR